MAMEVALRFWGAPYYRFNNRSMEYYTNPRGYHSPLREEGRYTIYGLEYRATEEGYRLPDAPARARPDGQALILGLGDSFLFGRGVRYADLYATRLGDALRHEGCGTGVRNCGVVGHDLPQILDTYRKEASKKRYPLVLYGFTLNDFGLPAKVFGSDLIDINNGGNVFDRLRSASKLYDLIRRSLDKLRLHRVVIEAYHQAFRGEDAAAKFEMFRRLRREVEAREGALVVVLFPLLYDLRHYPFQDIHEKLAAFCEKEGIPLLDLLPAFSRYEAEELWANPTDHHPNETAHGIAARELHDFLVKNALVPRDCAGP